MPFALKLSPALAAHLNSGGSGLSPLLLAGALLVLVGLVCDAVIIARFLPALQFRITPKPWGLRELSLGIAAFLTMIILTYALCIGIAIIRHKDLRSMTTIFVSVELFVRVAALTGFAIYFRRQHIKLRPALGFDTRPGWATGWGALFGLAILPPVGVLVLTSNAFCQLMRIPNSDQPIVDLFLKTESTALLVMLVVFAVIVAPIFEEFFFRGFAYPVLKQRLGMTRALLLVSAVFALNHFHLPTLVPLFILAIGLGLAYELTGSLLAPITMHALFNAIMILQVFYQRAHS